MFTGIIKEIGTIKSVNRGSGKVTLGVSSEKVIKEISIGSSVSINGACQTAVEISGNVFYVEAVEETLAKTTLGRLAVGSRVNLETALKISEGLEGHIVQGHVDGVGTITKIEEKEGSRLVSVKVPENVAGFMVEKGSIAVDGISLTIAGLKGNVVTISVIPFTIKETILSGKKQGDEVNIEADIIGKYIKRFMDNQEKTNGITPEWLKETGFI